MAPMLMMVLCGHQNIGNGVAAIAPFAWTYLKGPTPITFDRSKSVGPIGVEVIHII
jgi:ActR/RegA family two-component response regulator